MNIKVRPLTEDDYEQVAELDELSYSDVNSMLDCEEYAWGIFDGELLTGYCTIGGADELEDEFTNGHEAWLLSDVYVRDDYQNQGYATQMITTVIAHMQAEEHMDVFLTILFDELESFYSRLGFVYLKDGVMVKEYIHGG